MQSIMWDSTLQSIGDEPSPIGEEEYNARQRRLFSQLRPGDLLIVTAPHESTRSNDVHYPYRTSSEMLYLCGWEDPEAVFVAFNSGEDWVTSLFVQPKDVLMEIWEGRRPGVDGAKNGWPVDEAYSHKELDERLAKMLVQSKQIRMPLAPA